MLSLLRLFRKKSDPVSQAPAAVSAESGTSENLITIEQVLSSTSLEQLNRNADAYFQRFAGKAREILLSKPYTIRDVSHSLPTLGHLLSGLNLEPGMRVLDFGAGTCWVSRIVNQLGCEVVSLDVSPAALDLGRELVALTPVIGKQPPHLFQLFDGLNIDLPDNSFDRILCHDSFHHAPDRAKILKEMFRVLKDGGIAGFCEPGAEHSKHPASQQEMKLGVLENDVDLKVIEPLAKDIGFSQLKAYIWMMPSPLLDFQDIENFKSNVQLQQDILNTMLDFTLNNQIFYLYKQSSANSGGMDIKTKVAEITPEKPSYAFSPDQEAIISLRIVNTSNFTWPASGEDTGCVNFGAFLTLDGKPARDLRRGISETPVLPLRELNLSLDLGRLEPGNYVLSADLLQENVCWFKEHGSQECRVSIIVG